MENITGEIKISPLKVNNIAELKEKIKKSLNKKTTELLEAILGGTISLEASDLHFEPGVKESKIRIRIDGILQDVMIIDRKLYEALLSRIKLLAGVKLNIINRPQDGRFSILSSDNLSIEIRVSTLPAEKGESIVLRILNPKALIELETLGLRKDLLAVFKKEIKKPNGMIIVTGPTGSGKTTIAYALERRLFDQNHYD